MWGYIGMLQTLKAERFPWGGLGKNRNGVNKDGSTAYSGASQEHLHSQSVGTVIVPRWLENIIEHYKIDPRVSSDFYFDEYQGKKRLMSCVQCIESREHQLSERVKIVEDDFHISFVAPVPDPHPHHYEITIVPYAHAGLFDEMSKREAQSFARILHQTMMWINSLFPNCGYSYEMRQGPWKIGTYGLDEYYNQLFHWKFNIYPASSDLGTLRTKGFMSHLLGIPILEEAPENIAYRLRRQ